MGDEKSVEPIDSSRRGLDRQGSEISSGRTKRVILLAPRSPADSGKRRRSNGNELRERTFCAAGEEGQAWEIRSRRDTRVAKGPENEGQPGAGPPAAPQLAISPL